jgi:DNA-binding NarL/FixJ family response regulator
MVPKHPRTAISPSHHVAFPRPKAKPLVVNGGERPRVLIADHDGLARGMMRSALCDTAVVHVAANGREALELARYYEPAVVIIDTALPPSNGIELIAKVLAVVPGTRILSISADDDQGAVAALRAGAIGHITKDIDPDQLARQVTRAAGGEAIVPQGLIMPLLELVRAVPDGGWRPLHSRLTTREWEIIELIAQGATTQDIAERLVLSSTTVYSHIKSVMRKLGVHSRRDAVAAAEILRREETLHTRADRPAERSAVEAIAIHA